MTSYAYEAAILVFDGAKTPKEKGCVDLPEGFTHDQLIQAVAPSINAKYGQGQWRFLDERNPKKLKAIRTDALSSLGDFAS